MVLVLCKSVWVNKACHFFLVPSRNSSTPPYPSIVLRARERAPTLCPSAVFSLGFTFESRKELGVRHCRPTLSLSILPLNYIWGYQQLFCEVYYYGLFYKKQEKKIIFLLWFWNRQKMGYPRFYLVLLWYQVLQPFNPFSSFFDFYYLTTTQKGRTRSQGAS